MKTMNSITALMCFLALPAAQADYVTVHGTVGMLDAELVDYHTMERVGTVKIWNNRDHMHVVVKPFKDRYLLSKVNVYLSTEPAPEPVPDWYEEKLNQQQTELSGMNTLLGNHTASLATLIPGSADYILLSQEIDRLVADIAALNAENGALLKEYLSLCAHPAYGKWPYKVNFKKDLQEEWSLAVPIEDVEGLEWAPWGKPWLDQRLVTFAVRAELKSLDAVPVTITACAYNPYVPYGVQRTAWSDKMLALRYELQHPSHGQFDGPVRGLIYLTSTHGGVTGSEGGFSFFPGEIVDLWIGDVYLGSAVADQRISPLDLFPGQDISDPSVVNLARLFLALDRDGEDNKTIQITDESYAELVSAMGSLGVDELDFGDTATMDDLMNALGGATVEDAVAWLKDAVGSRLIRRNISKSPDYDVDKPKLDIVPVWVPARTADGLSTTVEYKDEDGNVISSRQKVKPLVVTYTEEQEPNISAGIVRRGSDIITAVSMDDGATWKRFNVSHMANKSSFTTKYGERFPGDSAGPRQKIVDDKIMVTWTSAYARGGKPSFAIKGDDDYPHDDAYVVNDVWGVRGRQGSTDYDEDKDVGDWGIGEIPYYALWACRGVLVWEGNAVDYPDREVGDIVWFKPERLTSGRRDAFFAMLHGARNAGFAVAWQEDPGGLLPGSCKGGGHGWSGATVHKKTDIWYSYIRSEDFALIDENWDPGANYSGDEQSEDAPDEHGQQPEISNRPKWLVPMSLPVRVSDNAVVNTENLKVELDPETGLPVIDPLTGTFIPLDGSLEEDFLATEHENEGGCGETDGDDGDDHDGDSDHGGRGGGWGMARYAYELPELGIFDLSLDRDERIWNEEVDGDYIPSSGMRWTRFINKPGVEKIVAVTADGRELDGNTGACRPSLQVMSGGWVLLGYEETKGLGIPPEGEHGEETDVERPVPDDKGKNVIYHSFKLDKPDMISAGNILNLPALDDGGELIPIYYKDANGESTDIFRQYKTENTRRIRFIAQSKSGLGSSRTIMLAAYRQGREGSGKPADVFVVRGVVPPGDTGNPYRFENLQRYDTGADTTDPAVMKGQRRHKNMSAATVESMDPVEQAGDGEGNTWNKVGKWKQYQGDMSAESFANPYSDAKAHRGFIRGDTVVFGYSFTPNWGRLGGDHEDFFVRRSFNGGNTFTTDPNGPEEVEHTVIERDPVTGEFTQKQYRYGRGEFEPGRNVSLLKGNKYTVEDPRLVPPMNEGSTVNKTYPEDDTIADGVYYVAFGTAEVLHGIGEPMGVETTEKEDVFYSRTTDGGSTWLMVPWEINPDSSSPDVGETVYRWPWLAQGGPHQGHVQIRMHPAGNRLYAIWHQFTHGDEWPISPHDVGNDIWFRRIDFMDAEE